MTNYWKINEDGKSELHFDFESFKALGEADKKEIKAYYLWSRGKSAWISKAKDDWRTKKIAERLNIPFEGKDKKLSFQEELEKKESKAEGRADRYEDKAIKAEKKAERLQSEFNRLRQDWSWLTQPIIKGHAGSERFARSKQRVLNSYSKGFEEYDKAEYFKRKKELAEETKTKPELKNLNYVQNRIKDAEKSIRALEKWIPEYTEKMESYKKDESKIATVSKYESAIEEGLQKLQYNYDKLAYYKLAYDEIMSHNKGGDIVVFDKSLSIDLGKYIKKYFKEKYSLSVSIATSAHYISIICRPSVPNEVRKSVALFIYPNERERIESWGDDVSIGNIRETYVTLHPKEWHEWLKIQGWDFGKKDFTQDIAEKYDITESEAKEAKKIETEHIDTLQKVYEHDLTPEQGVEEIVSDHLDESKDYYDSKVGLPAMEENLGNIVEINKVEEFSHSETNKYHVGDIVSIWIKDLNVILFDAEIEKVTLNKETNEWQYSFPKSEMDEVKESDIVNNKRDELVSDFVERLEQKESKILSSMLISSGSEVRASDSNQEKYIGLWNEYFYNEITPLDKVVFKASPKEVYDKLADDNYHNLNVYLTLKGFYGDGEKNQMVDSYVRYINLGYKNSTLNPIHFGIEVPATGHDIIDHSHYADCLKSFAKKTGKPYIKAGDEIIIENTLLKVDYVTHQKVVFAKKFGDNSGQSYFYEDIKQLFDKGLVKFEGYTSDETFLFDTMLREIKYCALDSMKNIRQSISDEFAQKLKGEHGLLVKLHKELIEKLDEINNPKLQDGLIKTTAYGKERLISDLSNFVPSEKILNYFDIDYKQFNGKDGNRIKGTIELLSKDSKYRIKIEECFYKDAIEFDIYARIIDNRSSQEKINMPTPMSILKYDVETVNSYNEINDLIESQIIDVYYNPFTLLEDYKEILSKETTKEGLNAKYIELSKTESNWWKLPVQLQNELDEYVNDLEYKLTPENIVDEQQDLKDAIDGLKAMLDFVSKKEKAEYKDAIEALELLLE